MSPDKMPRDTETGARSPGFLLPFPASPANAGDLWPLRTEARKEPNLKPLLPSPS